MEFDNRERISKGIEAITQFLKKWDCETEIRTFFFSFRIPFYQIFFFDGDLNDIFVRLFPTEKLDIFTKTLSLIAKEPHGISGNIEIHSGKVRIKAEDFKNNLIEMRDVLNNLSETYDRKRLNVPQTGRLYML